MKEGEARARAGAQKRFYCQAAGAAGATVILGAVNLLTSPGYLWFLWAALGMAMGLAFRAGRAFGNPKSRQTKQEKT